MNGVALELGQELARRIGVPFEPVVYPSVESVEKAGSCPLFVRVQETTSPKYFHSRKPSGLGFVGL
jgi:hypothetical protein